MNICAACHCLAPATAIFCPHCGKRITQSEKPPFLSKQKSIRITLFGGSAVAAGLFLLGMVYFVNQQALEKEKIEWAARLDQVEKQKAAAFAEWAEAQKQETAANESAARAKLSDPSIISGETARAGHQTEWKRRMAHEPVLANSTFEKTLVRMQSIISDATLSTQSALEEVARLAAPPGSRVEVMAAGDRFVVRVAFKMSALTDKEQGAVTKHHTTAAMKREVEALSAQVVRDVFDHCGARHIEQLFVSCNHAMRRWKIPEAATESERAELERRAGLVMGRLYRARIDQADSARVADWRALPQSQILQMMKVDRDGFKNLTIGSSFSRPGRQSDPEMKLEF